jgi:hypothetical protein
MSDVALSSKQRSFHVRTLGLAERIFCARKSDLSLYLSSHLGGSGKEIVSASVIPQDYGNAYDFSTDYLCAELMSKYPFWDLGIDRAGVALEKFRSAEIQCSRANARLVDLGANSLITVSTERVLMAARWKIQKLLGEFSWIETAENLRFGPGATTSKSRRLADVYYKIGDSLPECSHTLLPLLFYIRQEFPKWDFEAKLARGSRVVTVPKSAKTDRVICIEPDLNVLIQLGIGRSIRTRLRRVGLLYPDAQQRNAAAAEEGSITGSLATVDLSSASDTISKELVRCLMPSDWLQALEQARSPVALFEGRSIPLEKFSAMGNGYTFELETLIFWAIAKSVVEHHPEWNQRVLVYGDDIILDSQAVNLLSEVFDEVGFTMNPKKTFSNGPFRESCGKHYFRGVDVTPYYVRKLLKNSLDWYWAANTVRRHSRLSWGLDSTFKPAYDYAVEQLPRAHQGILIPDGYGDGGLISDWDEACPSRARHGQEGYRYRSFKIKPAFRSLHGPSLLYKSLYQLEKGAEEPDVRVPCPEKAKAYLPKEPNICAQWPSYGPWL